MAVVAYGSRIHSWHIQDLCNFHHIYEFSFYHYFNSVFAILNKIINSDLRDISRVELSISSQPKKYLNYEIVSTISPFMNLILIHASARYTCTKL